MRLLFKNYKIRSLLRVQAFKIRNYRKMAFNYPEIRRDESVKEVLHGVEIADPYRWLEDPDSEETKKFVEAQNAITRPYIDSCPHKEKIKTSLTELWNYPKYSHPALHGKKYYQYRNTGLQNQSVLYVQDNLEGNPEVFLDPNLLSEDGTVALSGTAFSEDGKVFAYGLSQSGSDWLEIKFRNTETGKDYDEVLKKVKFSSMTWMHDHKGFFYGAYLEQQGKADGSETVSNEYQKLYYHRLGSDQSQDVIVAEFDDPEYRIHATVSDCGKYLVLTPVKGCKNNLIYFAHVDPAKPIEKKLDLHEVVSEFEADFEYITNNGSEFIFRTNKSAPNYRLVVIDFDNPKESNWKVLIPEHAKDVLDWASAINNDYLVLCYLQDVKNVMSLHEINTGKKIYDFPLELGTIIGISGKRHYTEMFYAFCSFLTPSSIYRVTFNGPEVTVKLFHATKVGDFNPSLYETKQVFYESKDGTKVPMFIINKKGLVQNSTNPCLLYAYGGFNVSVTPAFSVSRLIFINKFNGVYALANIRGGGEYGDRWHNGARFENKQNCFDDFQYAAKYLVKEKYTTSEKLTIQGGSNGGLLVGACINQAPELFGAALCQVGVLDMLRYHKFTIGYAWKSDYGCSEIAKEFEYLLKYSPLHNIRAPKDGVQYPATLLLTADHDDRVVPLHSFKFIAELQYRIGKLEQQKNPLMIRIETRAGHGAGKPTSKIIDEITDMFCFVAKALNLKFEG